MQNCSVKFEMSLLLRVCETCSVKFEMSILLNLKFVLKFLTLAVEYFWRYE